METEKRFRIMDNKIKNELQNNRLKAYRTLLKSEKQQHEVQKQQLVAANLSLEAEVQELRRELQRAHELLEKKPHLQVRVMCITSSGT